MFRITKLPNSSFEAPNRSAARKQRDTHVPKKREGTGGKLIMLHADERQPKINFADMKAFPVVLQWIIKVWHCCRFYCATTFRSWRKRPMRAAFVYIDEFKLCTYVCVCVCVYGMRTRCTSCSGICIVWRRCFYLMTLFSFLYCLGIMHTTESSSFGIYGFVFVFENGF